MFKIFNTQLNGIFKKIDVQASEIDIAGRLLAQAVVGQGKIYVKGFGDLKHFEDFAVESKEKLFGAEKFITESIIDKTDRLLVMSDTYDEDTEEFINMLNSKDIDYVLVCNKNEKIDAMNYIDLSTPRALVPTEDFSRIITPHLMAMNYIYYGIYNVMYEMLVEEDEV
ncbi:DUF2529 family protein [Macrococcoides canis]|uniref:DUF2529 domain-containing protein n=1 Tax=Macrococcoides canis TaxID=1855823 RepID=A0A1W7AE55_9STAP|nr:DUF2529 family protein [Macrococcus canis]ARQ07877.1 hypothetical protein MCCS_22960 [Macrococcus canis]UTG99894.1 DUF2529 domain-containing protein [Macrococcus canis]WBF53115.1 DUF2529 domain-containing protein [Macrococcus canis]